MKNGSWRSRLYMALVLVLMYLPIVVTAVYSFNANSSRFTFQFTGFSLQHYKALFQDTSGLLDALWQSLQLALYSCLISAVLGTLGAVGMARRKFRFGGALEGLALLPAMTPEIIMAMGFLAVFTRRGPALWHADAGAGARDLLRALHLHRRQGPFGGHGPRPAQRRPRPWRFPRRALF